MSPAITDDHPEPLALTAFYVPRPDQQVASERILAARKAGSPGFLLGDLTGLGKTLSVWSAVAAMPESEVLIICPKGAMPQWRRTIARSAQTAKSVTITNYERTKALMAPPALSTRRSTRARNNELAKHGALRRSWPLVIFDDAHRLRNPSSQQSMVCRQLADAAVFTIFMSATAGQSPHELAYLGKLLGAATGAETTTMDGFRQLMKTLRMGKARGRWKNWSWEANEPDRARMAEILYKGESAIGLRRRPGDILGWPEVQRTLAPTALDAATRKLYDANWRAFRHEIGLGGGSTRTPSGRVAELRFRQKASLLRVNGTADFAEQMLDEGLQTAISVAFLETGTLLLEALTGRGWKAGQITGEHSSLQNEQTRQAFQRGALDVVIFTVTEAISLHRNEMPGGERERALIVHDIRHSAIQAQQIEGRCHRNGERAVIHYAYAEESVEEMIASLALSRMASMDGMAGDDTTLLDEISAALETVIGEREATGKICPELAAPAVGFLS
ncbi:MAG: DEAD/DEAH box helicase family protein [Beijerinckiaceae bacterium]